MLPIVEQARESRRDPARFQMARVKKWGLSCLLRSVLCPLWDSGSLYRMPACPCSSRGLCHQGGRGKDQLVPTSCRNESEEEGLNLLGQGWRVNTGRAGPGKRKLVTKNIWPPSPLESLCLKKGFQLSPRREEAFLFSKMVCVSRMTFAVTAGGSGNLVGKPGVCIHTPS